MLYEHRGHRPAIHPSAWVSPSAEIRGRVTVGRETSILPGAVVSAQGSEVVIGPHCVIMETAVIRSVPGHPCHLGAHVLVGPRAHLSGCAVDELSFLATGVTVLNGAKIGRLGDLRINAVVHVRTSLPPRSTVPIGWVAVGDPAEILPPGDHDRIWEIQRRLGFKDAAFRMGDLPREEFMRRMTSRYARALARHRDDRPRREDESGAGHGAEGHAPGGTGAAHS